MFSRASLRSISSRQTRPSSHPLGQRFLHQQLHRPVIPPPIPWIPDVKTFLTAIGRGLSQHSDKFNSWDHLFTASSAEMRGLGLEPSRARRYLIHWREKFRNGEFGLGGDFTKVKDGLAELRIVEVPIPERKGKGATATQPAGVKKVPVNVDIGDRSIQLSAEEAKKPSFIKLRGPNFISGRYVEPIKGTEKLSYRVKMKEGIWEERRGVKKHGGERRRAEFLVKKRAAERKAAEDAK